MIKAKTVNVIQIPHYEGLWIKDMINWGQGLENGKVLDYLPVTEKEILKMPRAYIGNIIYTVLG